jgi:hypothetical protein
MRSILPKYNIAGIVLAVLAVMIFVANYGIGQGGGNMNSRFNDSNPTYRSVTSTTGTFTTLTTTTANITTLNKGGSTVSSTAAELNLLNGVTAGTVTASKAIVAGTSKQVDSLTVNYLRAKQIIWQIAASPAAACTLYATGTYRSSGTLFLARPLAAKSTCLLDSNCVVGTIVDAIVADADSFRFSAAGTDSIIVANGSADKVIGTVAGSCRLIKAATRKWFLLFATGTWTASKT